MSWFVCAVCRLYSNWFDQTFIDSLELFLINLFCLQRCRFRNHLWNLVQFKSKGKGFSLLVIYSVRVQIKAIEIPLHLIHGLRLILNSCWHWFLSPVKVEVVEVGKFAVFKMIVEVAHFPNTLVDGFEKGDLFSLVLLSELPSLGFIKLVLANHPILFIS